VTTETALDAAPADGRTHRRPIGTAGQALGIVKAIGPARRLGEAVGQVGEAVRPADEVARGLAVGVSRQVKAAHGETIEAIGPERRPLGRPAGRVDRASSRRPIPTSPDVSSTRSSAPS
jgi:hypothetical protein